MYQYSGFDEIRRLWLVNTRNHMVPRCVILIFLSLTCTISLRYEVLDWLILDITWFPRCDKPFSLYEPVPWYMESPMIYIEITGFLLHHAHFPLPTFVDSSSRYQKKEWDTLFIFISKYWCIWYRLSLHNQYDNEEYWKDQHHWSY